jgi:two-component system cell cycle response regulator DivK
MAVSQDRRTTDVLAPPLILVVEDDPETRRAYACMFGIGGFRIEEAHNGFQALEKALADLPDLILTDISLPGIDGIELCRRLRIDERTRRVPVLAVTGYADRDYCDRALQAGADAVLLKPCDDEVLLREAKSLILKSHALRRRSDAALSRAEAARVRSTSAVTRSRRTR